MPAYFFAEIEISNPTGMEPHRAAVPATIAHYGGRFLSPGGGTAEQSKAGRSRNGLSSSSSPISRR